jgi:hypothetical protein
MQRRPTEEDMTIGEVQEAMSSFTERIRFTRMMESKNKFSVPNQGVVTVAAHAYWDRPAACKEPKYKIELVKKIGPRTSTSQGVRTYPTSGMTHTETWSGLSAGTYFFYVSSIGDNPYCTLLGSMSVSIKP